MILPPVESDIPDQKSAYQRQQDMMTEFYNSLAALVFHLKVLSMVGVEAPQEEIEEARSRLPSEASMAAQALGSIPAIATRHLLLEAFLLFQDFLVLLHLFVQVLLLV